MHKCRVCKNEMLDAYVIVDTAHHIVRTWCSFCKVWWSVKYKTQNRSLSQGLRQEMYAVAE
jgi:hypothetical protein